MKHGEAKQPDMNDFGPVWGCILIGGKSARMGTPKHLLQREGITWLELILSRLMERTENVVISGDGPIPESLREIPVVKDDPGIRGPLAGIISVFRSYPDVSWVVTACDMPDINNQALDWLLGQRDNGVKAILPDLNGNGLVEPLLAYYDRSCHDLLEQKVSEGEMRPGGLVGHAGVRTPLVPFDLHSSWKNYNSIEDLSS